MTELLVAILSLAAAIACGFLSFAGLGAVVDLLRVLRRRFSFTERLRRIFPKEIRQTGMRKHRTLLPAPVLIGLALGLGLAILWHHSLLSLWWIALGVLSGWVLISTRPFSREALQILELFVSGLRNIYPVYQSVSGALETASACLPERGAGGELKAMVTEVLRRINASLPMKESLQIFQESGWPLLGRLSTILEQVEHADEESALKALETLQDQIHAARMLLDRANTVLVLNRLTLRALQIANLAGVLLVSVVPTWHRFYNERPFGLVAATAMALAGTWYFSSEIRRMEAMLL